MKYLVFSLLFIASVSAIDVKFEDCGSPLGKIKSVSVAPCETQPCKLQRGSNYTIGIDFSTDGTVEHMKAIIHGIVAGIPVPFPFDKPDACQDSGLKCPLAKEQIYHYTATLPVLSDYPAIKLVVEWELQDTDQKADVVCVEIAAEVVLSENDSYSNDRKKVVNRLWEEY